MTLAKSIIAIGMVFGLFISTGYLGAQGISGTVRGDARDPSGALVPGTSITVTNVATGENYTQVTTSAGTFDFPNLLVGRYTVTADMAGFKRYSRTNVDVKANQVVEVAVRLEVGAPEQTVEVVG